MWAIENPADRGDDTSPAHWKKFSDQAPLWLSTPIRELELATGARCRTFAQCALGGVAQKWTTLLHPAGWEQLAALGELGCPLTAPRSTLRSRTAATRKAEAGRGWRRRTHRR